MTDFPVLFREFLDDHEALELFTTSFCKYRSTETIASYLENTAPENYLIGAFLWEDHEPSSHFWSDLNEYWEGILQCMTYLERVCSFPLVVLISKYLGCVGTVFKDQPLKIHEEFEEK
jgi:hypothetical protein